jgi:hypothetical protein
MEREVQVGGIAASTVKRPSRLITLYLLHHYGSHILMVLVSEDWVMKVLCQGSKPTHE